MEKGGVSGHIGLSKETYISQRKDSDENSLEEKVNKLSS